MRLLNNGFFKSNRWNRELRHTLGLDLRSVALFRIGLAVTLLFDNFCRLRDIRAHYTDEGIMPLSVAKEWLSVDGLNISLHTLNGSFAYQFLLFLFAILCNVALLLGYRTRFAIFLSWILLISTQNRNQLILDNGDLLLRVLTFWALFLPLDRYWSWEKRKSPHTKKKANPFLSVGTFGVLLQIALMYFFTAFLKTHPIWTTEHTAIYYALHLDILAKPFASTLLEYPGLLKLLTISTLWLERLGPLLIFFPFITNYTRLAACLFFICFHFIGIGLTLKVGIFRYVCVVAWLLILPPLFWEKMVPFCKNLFFKRKRTQTKIPQKGAALNTLTTEEIRPHYKELAQIFPLFFALYITLWNVRTLDEKKYAKVLPEKYNWIGNFLRLDQWWNMFAPYPLMKDGWYVIPASLKDGTRVNLFNKSPHISWEKPEDVSITYINGRWRKYLMNLSRKDFSIFRPFYAAYLKREWNNTHSHRQHIDHYQICFMEERTPPPGTPLPIPKKRIFWDSKTFELIKDSMKKRFPRRP